MLLSPFSRLALRLAGIALLFALVFGLSSGTASADDSAPDSVKPPKDVHVIAVAANQNAYGVVWDNTSDTVSYDLLIRMTPVGGGHVATGGAVAQPGQSDGRVYPWLASQTCGAKFRVEVETMVAGRQVSVYKGFVSVSCGGSLPTLDKESAVANVTPIPGLFLMVTPTTRNVVVLYYSNASENLFVDVQLTPAGLPTPGTIINMVLKKGDKGLKVFPWTYSRAPRCLEQVRQETWVSQIPTNRRLYHAVETVRTFLCLG